MQPYYEANGITIYHGDYRDVLPQLAWDGAAIITDPPYPDYYTEEYEYHDGILDPIKDIRCRQLIFWSGRAVFPLDHTACHIWNKNPSNHGAQYERIFERNGGAHQKVFTYYMVNSTVAAAMTGDVFNDHPSQKPIRLMMALLQHAPCNVAVDLFMGSGTTLHAAKNLGRKAIGIEKKERYCEIAARRLSQEVMELV